MICAADLTPPTEEALKDVFVLNFNCITFLIQPKHPAEQFQVLLFYGLYQLECPQEVNLKHLVATPGSK